MPNLYFGRWEGFVSGDRRCWRAPGGDGTGLDLRTLSEQAVPVPANGAAGGFGIFTYDAPRTHALLTVHLGSDIQGAVGPAKRNAMENALGGVPIQAVRLDNVLAELFLSPTHTDPDGILFRRPITGSRRGGVKLFVRGIGDIMPGTSFGGTFNDAHPAFARTIGCFRSDYRRHVLENTSLLTRRRMVGAMMRHVWGAMRDDFADALMPPENRQDGWEQPQTTLADDFGRADNTDLNAANTGKLLNGAAGTWSWTEVVGDWSIVSNQLRLNTSGGSTGKLARADQDLSSGHHFAQVDVTALTAGNYTAGGVACRFAAAATTCYYSVLRLNAGTDGFAITKIVAGVETQLTSTTLTPPGLPDTVKLIVDDSSQIATVNGANTISATDSAIGANLRVGVAGYSAAGTNRATIDNWSAEDVAAAGILRQMMQHLN